MSAVLERFLRYVRYDTQADESSDTYPSTPTQLLLLRELARELETLGAADVRMDDHGYVTATVPATSAKADIPAIGFIAHVDTSPEMSGAGVTPIVHRRYDGRDIVLPDDSTVVLRRAENPALGERIGDDIVTASGTTLLGADNKAGVAEIYSGHHVPVEDLQIAEGQATAILLEAGVDARWISCDRGDDAEIEVPPECGRPPGPKELVLRMRPAGLIPGTHDVSMGSSLVGAGASGMPVFSTVHPDRVTVVADAARVDRRVLLGRAIAHEIGHLLLDTSRHAERGLMRARWSTRELRQEADADWKFLQSESETMVAALARRHRDWSKDGSAVSRNSGALNPVALVMTTVPTPAPAFLVEEADAVHAGSEMSESRWSSWPDDET